MFSEKFVQNVKLLNAVSIVSFTAKAGGLRAAVSTLQKGTFSPKINEFEKR